jgi:ankyrin repeat protein
MKRNLLSGALLTTLIVAIAHLTIQNLKTSHRAHLNALLVTAVEKADALQVTDLLRQGADPNVKVPDKQYFPSPPPPPPPSWKERFYHFLSPPCCEGQPVSFERPALLHAMFEESTNIAQSLLAAGANPNVTDERGSTPLCLALDHLDDPPPGPRQALIKMLISKGADVNQGNPLARAAEMSTFDGPATGSPGIQNVQLLLAHGATVQGKAGQVALVAAAGSGNLGVVKLLLGKGIRSNADDLVEAARTGRLETVRFFLDKGISANAKTSYSETALLACERSEPNNNITRLLLQRGANVNARALDGSTALFYANRSVAQILLDHNADVNAKRNDGNTVLTIAALRGKGDMIKLMLAHGADFHLRNRAGHTALMLAVANKRKEAATILRAAGERQ